MTTVMAPNTDKVMVVIINYNGYQDTIECLESLLKSDYHDFQVTVIDNSDDPTQLDKLIAWAKGENILFATKFEAYTLPKVKKPIDHALITEAENSLKNYPLDNSVIFIKTENRGFAAANNIVLNRLKDKNLYRYIWLLNNDTVVDAKTLEALVGFANQSHSRQGMIGSKLLLYYSPNTLQGIGGRYYKWFGQVREIGSGEKDLGQWNTAKEDMIDYVIGASIFLKNEFVHDVGPMEEDYFLYYEELDWSIRARQRGWKLAFCPDSKVYHKMGSSINKNKVKGNSYLADYYSVRNRILITKKYFPLALITLYPSFLKFVVNRLLIKQYDRIWMLVKLMLNPYKHLKRI